MAGPATAAADAVSITSVLPRVEEDRFLLEIEAAGPFPFRVWRTRTPPKVIADLEGRLEARLPRMIPVDDPAIERVRLEPGPLGARIVIDLAYDLPAPTVDAAFDRLTISVATRFRHVEEIAIAPGIRFGQIRSGEVHGPVSAKYLKVDTRRARVAPRLAGERFSRGTVREIAAAEEAIAAVNGGYFHWNGRPLGLLVLEGLLVSEPLYERTAFLVDREGRPHIDRVGALMSLVGPGGEPIGVDGVNRPRERGEIVVYTQHYREPPRADAVRMVVRGSRVEAAGPAASGVALGPEDFAVEFDPGDPRLSKVQAGDFLRFEYILVGEEVFSPGSVAFALGGGPRLVRDGRVDLTGNEERFQPDILVGRAPRTAVGITADGELILLVVDGRDEKMSRGVTLSELAMLLIDLGAVSAMNLDGGGSSTLVVRGATLNRPSDGDERAVASALVVYADGGERAATGPPTQGRNRQ